MHSNDESSIINILKQSSGFVIRNLLEYIFEGSHDEIYDTGESGEPMGTSVP